MSEIKNVLIVDDDRDFIDAYTMILEKEGFQVSSAMTGAEGLKKAKDLHPNIIILDVMMESADSGFEFAQNLKSSGINIPIILSSSIANASAALFDTQSLNVKTVMQKPVDIDNFIKMVKKYMA